MKIIDVEENPSVKARKVNNSSVSTILFLFPGQKASCQISKLPERGVNKFLITITSNIYH